MYLLCICFADVAHVRLAFAEIKDIGRSSCAMPCLTLLNMRYGGKERQVNKRVSLCFLVVCLVDECSVLLLVGKCTV